MSDETKTCSKCGEAKPLESFHRDSASKYGRRSRCKSCLGCTKEVNTRPDVKPSNRYPRHLERTKKRLKRLRDEMLKAYGGRCVCCGITEPKFLTLDHINNDGAEHRGRVGRGASFYAWLKREGYPRDGFQLLCYNCNCAKGFYGECPHLGH